MRTRTGYVRSPKTRLTGRKGLLNIRFRCRGEQILAISRRHCPGCITRRFLFKLSSQLVIHDCKNWSYLDRVLKWKKQSSNFFLIKSRFVWLWLRFQDFFFHIQSIFWLIVGARKGNCEMMMHQIYNKIGHVIDHDIVDRWSKFQLHRHNFQNLFFFT